MLKRFLLGALAALCLVSQALAQSSVLPYWINSSGVKVPTGSGNPLPVTASVSISGFAPATTGTPITATTGGVTGSLPAGAVVVATNVGTTNGAYCKLGASATTSDQYIAPNGGWFAFTVGAATQLTCITSSSTTTVNMVGGSGIPTGTGGGGGGSGGGGAVTIADGADVAEGATTDAAATAGGAGSLSAKMRLMTTQLNTINTTLGTPFQAGGSIGNTSFGATQSGTWNINNISGTISLPTGAATAANQTTANSSLSTIATLAASPVPCFNATSSTTNSYSNGGTNPANCDLNGNLYVNAKIAAGQTVAATQSGTWTVQPGNTANTTAWLVTGTGGTFPATQSGTWTVQPGNTANTTPWLTNNSAADPCQTTANSGATINISSATTTRIITPSASNRTYICSIDLLSFAANNVAIVEGTGGTCGTGTAGIVGGTTTGAGISFPAQGGLVKGGAGSWVWRTAGTNVDFCLITSTTGPLTGYVKYVQAP